MSQGALSVSNGDGATVRAAFNAALARLASRASGTARPADIATYEIWVETDNPGAGIVSVWQYDGTSDVLLGLLDTSTHAFAAYSNGALVTSAPSRPQGRLTLATGTPVMSSAQIGKTVVYYALYEGDHLPIYDGSAAFAMTAFTELSNDLTASSTGKAGPAAAGPYQCIDLFGWSDGGTPRLTRGPAWTKSANVTMTIATPGVVTWTAHGLYTGATVRFATTGALPTGLSAATDYFVTKIDADTFYLSTSIANQIAGTYIATSGSQSGTHTAYNYTIARGTGAATSELQRVNGIWTNKYAITNGPGANLGTYLGTILTDGSSQANWQPGATAAGGTAAILGVWNCYNRVDVEGVILDSTDSWTYSATTIRPSNNSPGMRATFVYGLGEDAFAASQSATKGSSGGSAAIGIGFNATAAFSGRQCYLTADAGTRNGTGEHAVQGVLGSNYMQGLEVSDAAATHTWYGDNGGSLNIQTGFTYRGIF